MNNGLPLLRASNFPIKNQNENYNNNSNNNNNKNNNDNNNNDNNHNNNNDNNNNNNNNNSSLSCRPQLQRLDFRVVEIVTEMIDAIELSIWDAVVDRVG